MAINFTTVKNDLTEPAILVHGDPAFTGAPTDNYARLLELGTAGQLLGTNAAGDDFDWYDPSALDFAALPQSETDQGEFWPKTPLGLGEDDATIYKYRRTLRRFGAYVTQYKRDNPAAPADFNTSETSSNYQISMRSGDRHEIRGFATLGAINDNDLGFDPYNGPSGVLRADNNNGQIYADAAGRFLIGFSSTINMVVDRATVEAEGYTYQNWIGTQPVSAAAAALGYGTNPVVSVALSVLIDRTASGNGRTEYRGTQLWLPCTAQTYYVGVEQTLQSLFSIYLSPNEFVQGRMHIFNGGSWPGALLMTADRSSQGKVFAQQVPHSRIEYV